MRFLKDTAGAAAAEFALWLALLIVPLMSVADFGYFAFQRMQVDIAGQAAAQAVWRLCDTQAKLSPATDNCAGLANAITVGAQSTALGSAVTVASGSPVDGYYCAYSDDTLKPAAAGATWTIGGKAPPKPGDCTYVKAGNPAKPAEYVNVTVEFDFTPIFSLNPIAALLPDTISSTSWVRLI
jgi:hypothetical protein